MLRLCHHKLPKKTNYGKVERRWWRDRNLGFPIDELSLNFSRIITVYRVLSGISWDLLGFGYNFEQFLVFYS